MKRVSKMKPRLAGTEVSTRRGFTTQYNHLVEDQRKNAKRNANVITVLCRPGREPTHRQAGVDAPKRIWCATKPAEQGSRPIRLPKRTQA